MGRTGVSHLMESGLVRLCGVILFSDGGRGKEREGGVGGLPHDPS